MEIGAAYAHSLSVRPVADWEPQPTHLQKFASLAAPFADVLSWAEVARMAGLLHDVGKCSAEFLAYIRARQRALDRGVAGSLDCVSLG